MCSFKKRTVQHPNPTVVLIISTNEVRSVTPGSYAARFACGETISRDPYGGDADAEVLRRTRQTVSVAVVGLRLSGASVNLRILGARKLPLVSGANMSPKDREAVSEVLKRRVSEIRKMFDPKVSSYSKSVRALDDSGSEVRSVPPERDRVEVDDVQQAMLTQIMLLAQDLDVAFDEQIFVDAVRVAAEEA
jgi:hypothetical protein